MSHKSLKSKTSTLPSTSDLLITSDRDNSDVSPCLEHLYVPHERYHGKELQCFGKGVMLRGRISSGVCFRFLDPSAGRATTSYLRKATLGAQAVAIVSKMLVSVSISRENVDPSFVKQMENLGWVSQRGNPFTAKLISQAYSFSVALSLRPPPSFAAASGALCAQYYRRFSHL
jgi:hypothetical protein